MLLVNSLEHILIYAFILIVILEAYVFHALTMAQGGNHLLTC